MINSNNITVSIQYKFMQSEDWILYEIDPEEYFDNNYAEEDEILLLDSISLYNHAIDYIKIDNKKDIVYTELLIHDKVNNDQSMTSEFYWNSQNNALIERIDSDGYNLIIISTRTNENPQIQQIIRLERAENTFEVVHHSFITENADGSETEEKII